MPVAMRRVSQQERQQPPSTPGSGQHAWLNFTVGPNAKTAKLEAIDY